MAAMSKTVAIIQSNYIPWKGYFDMIGLADEFLLLDNVQFTKNSWRNRNRLKTPQGTAWLTIPVKTGGRFGQTIEETEVASPDWAATHWAKWQACYAGAPHFRSYAPRLEAAYKTASELTRLSDINALLIAEICALLGISTTLTPASTYVAEGVKTDRVIALCRAAGATHYLSGPAAQEYIETEKFAAAGIDLTYMDYGGYPEYAQPYGPFDHAVSALDLLFAAGPEAPRYMKFRNA